MGKGYLSYTMALILQSLDNGYRYGFDIMTITGLASGTVYPAFRRLEDAGFVVSKWERSSIAQQEQRPTRKYYEVSKSRPNRVGRSPHPLSAAGKLQPLAYRQASAAERLKVCDAVTAVKKDSGSGLSHSSG